ncbi:XAC0095 family protein [Luteimonas sp. A478]
MTAHESNHQDELCYQLPEESQFRLVQLRDHIRFLAGLAQPRIADESLECAPEVRLIDLAFCLERLAEQLDLVLGEVRWRAQPSAVEAGVSGCGATPAVGGFVFGVTPDQFDALDRVIHTISAQGDAVAASHMADLARPTLPVLGQAIFDGATTLAELLAQVHEQRLDSRSGVAEPRAEYGELVDARGARRDIGFSHDGQGGFPTDAAAAFCDSGYLAHWTRRSNASPGSARRCLQAAVLASADGAGTAGRIRPGRLGAAA